MQQFDTGDRAVMDGTDDRFTIIRHYAPGEGMEHQIVEIRSERTGEHFHISTMMLYPDPGGSPYQSRLRWFNIMDLPKMGITIEQWRDLRYRGLMVYNAPRPLPRIWQDAEGRYIDGVEWMAPFFAGHFFVAVDPVGYIYGKTMDQEMVIQDAHRVGIMTNTQCEKWLRSEMLRRDPEIDFDQILADDPRSLRISAEALGLPWRP